MIYVSAISWYWPSESSAALPVVWDSACASVLGASGFSLPGVSAMRDIEDDEKGRAGANDFGTRLAAELIEMGERAWSLAEG